MSGRHNNVLKSANTLRKMEMRALSLKYPRLTRQTVSDFKKAHLESKRDGIDVNSEGIVTKNRGRPTLLPEDIMKKTIDTVSALRLRGASVTSSVINAVAKGIVQANDRTLLVLKMSVICPYPMIGRERFYVAWTPLAGR